MESKIAHLKMVQAVITRMAGNSFLIKGWSVTLVAALFALAAAAYQPAFRVSGLLPNVHVLGARRLLFATRAPVPEAVRPRPDERASPRRFFNEHAAVHQKR